MITTAFIMLALFATVELCRTLRSRDFGVRFIGVVLVTPPSIIGLVGLWPLVFG